MPKNCTILITGGAGYIGTHTLLALQAEARPFVVFDNLTTGKRELLPEGVTLVEGDCGDADAVRQTLRNYQIGAVIHFAGSIIVAESVRDPLTYYQNNTANVCVLLDAMIAERVPHIVFSSTAAVYGNPSTLRVAEDAPLVPLSPYGHSKLFCERILRDAATAYGLRHVTLRYFNVAGADPKMRTGQSGPATTHLIRTAAQAAAGVRKKVDIFGTDYPTPDGTCIRDYIHVSDLAQAHVAALDYLDNNGPSTTLNCGYGRGASVREVIEAVKRVTGSRFSIQETTRRKGDSAQLVADVSRIHRTLNWRPRYDNLDLIVAHACEWEKRLLTER